MKKVITKKLQLSTDHLEQALVNYLRILFKGQEVIGANLTFDASNNIWYVDTTLQLNITEKQKEVVDATEKPSRKRKPARAKSDAKS